MPTFLASMVTMLVKDLGISEHTALWGIPLARVNQYEHSLLVSQDAKCRWMERSSSTDQGVAALIAKWGAIQ